MAHLAVGIFVVLFALLLSFGLCVAAIAIAVSRLGENESEPVDSPHRPIWR